ncbi:MAG: BTAD domain-containing putative transcriptional regulator [Caldilinea sp.]
MAVLQISLFGRLRCMVDNDPVGGIEARKVQELLTYLLLHRTHPCTRESLATLMWGERNDAQAKKYLRQALWQLQSALDAACHPTIPLLHVDAEWVEINQSAPIWLDIEHFEHVYETTCQLEGCDLSDKQVDALCQAAALYQGDLLEGWYQDWCIFERERYQQMYLTMLDKLIAFAEHTHDYMMGVHYCELSLRNDPARERTHRRLMRLYHLAGNRTAALRQFETCVEMLHRDLGVEPAKSTLLLYEQIRSDQFGAPDVDDSPHSLNVESESSDLSDILAHLSHLQSTLIQTLQQVQRDIERVEVLIQRHTAEAPANGQQQELRRMARRVSNISHPA